MRKTTKTKINSIDTEAIKRTESSKKYKSESPQKTVDKKKFYSITESFKGWENNLVQIGHLSLEI